MNTGAPPLVERRWLEETGSTQDDALAWVREIGATPGRCVAARQRGGRGRGSHQWESPPGGLYLSAIIPTPSPPDPLLPLAVGADLAALLERMLALEVRLKWPNDLVVAPPPLPAAKVGGILVDVPAVPDGRFVVVVGVGLNVNAPTGPKPPELRRRGAVLSERIGRAVDLASLETAVDSCLRSTVAGLATSDGPSLALASCRARLFGVGQRVAVDGHVGGRLSGLGEDGALLLQEEGRVREVRAGDLLLLGD
jgi:BirA family transcriptional regulator, biotin operon repressor / biotin---[acetyl-CoA-carboxylase] ligase